MKSMKNVTIEMAPGWYAKTMNHFAQEYGPFPTQRQAVDAVRVIPGLEPLDRKVRADGRGGLMTVAR